MFKAIFCETDKLKYSKIYITAEINDLFNEQNKISYFLSTILPTLLLSINDEE